MGYTHYFEQGKVCPTAAWEKICADFNKVLQVGRMSKVFPRLKSEYGDADDWAKGKDFADQVLGRTHALPNAMTEDA